MKRIFISGCYDIIHAGHIQFFEEARAEAPLCVDFAGGWLDVPRHSVPGKDIVNCSITPMVSLREWNYEKKSGLGGSGAWALLNGRDGVLSEDILKLAEGVQLYHEMQLDEGMEPLPEISGELAKKSCGGGFGGYALYLFDSKSSRDSAVEIMDDLRVVEPYIK